jgi:hypothetical protein
MNKKQQLKETGDKAWELKQLIDDGTLEGMISNARASGALSTTDMDTALDMLDDAARALRKLSIFMETKSIHSK